MKILSRDDLSLFSRYNNREDFDGAIAYLKIYNNDDVLTNSYDFIKYNNENKFLNTITNKYDLKIFGEYSSGIIHDLDNTGNIYNSSMNDLSENKSENLILFFKKDTIDLENDKILLY